MPSRSIAVLMHSTNTLFGVACSITPLLATAAIIFRWTDKVQVPAAMLHPSSSSHSDSPSQVIGYEYRLLNLLQGLDFDIHQLQHLPQTAQSVPDILTTVAETVGIIKASSTSLSSGTSWIAGSTDLAEAQDVAMSICEGSTDVGTDFLALLPLFRSAKLTHNATCSLVSMKSAMDTWLFDAGQALDYRNVIAAQKRKFDQQWGGLIAAYSRPNYTSN
ncbi:hypothetical protein FB45DRAFT_932523 [Roridomyces roridus]|uniref:Uncharacterized protein n=1 Tax=Roridomyces roridus TaxID=1738132 RepID=A0AAD7FFV3_9AGAR|nr:hypothetical protein FB45DRAFT_932523 [Roridomyces roridus]